MQRLPVRAADVPAAGQLGQRAEGGRRAHGLVGAAVHHLQQLDRELHVAEPTGPQLELASGLAGGDVLDHPSPHRLDVLDEAGSLRRLPDQRPDRGGVLLAERAVAGDRTCLEQRLELPGLGPATVVAGVAGDRAHERPGLALGPERGVHRPDRALAGLLGADLHQRRRELGGAAQGSLLVGAVHRLGHEDHVHVAHVVELVAAALAHRDHGQPAAGRGVADLGPGHGESGVEGAGREVRELGGDVVHVEVVGEVAAGEAEQDPAVLHPERVTRRMVLERRERLGGPGVGADGLHQPGADGEGRRACRPQRGVGQLTPVLRVPAQVVAEREAHAQHAEQPHRRALVVDEGGEQVRRVGDGVDERQQAGERLVGVGRPREQRRERFGGLLPRPRSPATARSPSRKPMRTRLPEVTTDPCLLTGSI